jgi:hypothetical protein
MTAPTYHADEDQMTQGHDQAISEDNLVEQVASLTVPEPDLLEPNDDLTTADADVPVPDANVATAEPDLIEPDADAMAPDLADPGELAEPDADETAHEVTSDPAGEVDLADSEPATSMVSGHPGFIADGDDGAAEPEMADGSPGSPSLVSVDFTVHEAVTDSPPAETTARTAGPWNEIQAMFVDDPRASIESAAGLVDGRVEELIQSLTERQHSIQSGWQADDAGTEELRVALRHYRTFWNSLDDLPAPA